MSAYFCPAPDAHGSNLEPSQASPLFIGKIEAASGVCTLSRFARVATQVKPGDFVYEGDVVDAAADGHVCIRLIDGTVCSLGSNARMALSEFNRRSTAPSALFRLTRGCFSFIGGTIAKAGRFEIETPVASIRNRSLLNGLGFLSFAGFFFATMEEIQAASSGVAFLDDGVITFKDLEHGIFELVTKEAAPQHIVVDDPGETIVLRRFGSSISESHITNSLAQMLQLETAQQEALHIFALGLQGPTATGTGGSSTPPGFQFPFFVQPINFTQPDGSSPPLTIPDNAGAGGHASSPSDLFFIPPPPPSPPSPPPSSGSVVELLNVTGANTPDSATGTLPLSGSLSIEGPKLEWSGGTVLPDGISDDLSPAHTLIITPSGSGTAKIDFSAPDDTFDFLAAGETLTITYEVTGTGANGATSTQPVVVTIVGSNDVPDVTSSAQPVCIFEDYDNANYQNSDVHFASGTIIFADVDLNDRPTVTTVFDSFSYKDGCGIEITQLSDAQRADIQALETGLQLSPDGNNANDGSVTWSYSIADSALDFLARGETLTLTYLAQVDDGHGGIVTQPLTVTVHGANDAPVLAADASGDPSSSGSHPTAERAGRTGDTLDNDIATGTLSFTDVDLDDTHTASATLGSAVWSTGDTLPAGLHDVLATALSTTEHDSTGSGSGTIDFTFSAPDNTFDFLAA
ncbi:MAG TPA: VCBS domain-containing protein, partial [Lacipirellulaceae bacterium]|nr:VCBS domain-containing protein [Lacipirellulaceae bacterium]